MEREDVMDLTMETMFLIYWWTMKPIRYLLLYVIVYNLFNFYALLFFVVFDILTHLYNSGVKIENPSLVD